MVSKRLFWISPVLLLSATLTAQSSNPNLQVAQPTAPPQRPKFGGVATAPAPARSKEMREANVKTELGMNAVITPEMQIQRLQKKVAELTQLARSLQSQVDSLNSSIEALNKSTITYRCELGPGGARSVNSLGVAMECSPYSCDPTSGRCFRPPCARTDECGPGTVCDVGGTNLCVWP